MAVPFCTIAQGAASALPGDSVLVYPATYREQITPPLSGSPGLAITYGAAAPGVVILGTTDVSDPVGWSPTSTNAWSRPYAPPSPPSQVFKDGVRLAQAASTTGTTVDSFFHDSVAKVLYVDIGGPNPGLGHVIEAGARAFGFNLVGRADIVVDGFEIQAPNRTGIRLNTSSSITVRNSKVLYPGTFGIQADTCAAPFTIKGNEVSFSLTEGIRIQSSVGINVQENISHHNIGHGIGVRGGSSNQIVRNALYSNRDPNVRRSVGLDVSVASTDNLIQGNTAYSNDDSGIQIYSGSERNLLVRNVSRNNGDHGFDVNAAGDVRCISNTSYGNAGNGFNLEAGAANALLMNNIAADNGLATEAWNLRVGTTSAPGFVANCNLYWKSVPGDQVWYAGTVYPSVAEFMATGNEADGLEGDPLFQDAPSGNLRLMLGSQAIDSADAAAPGFVQDDHDGLLPLDIPSVADTGEGVPAFSDRGAHEYVDARPVAVLAVEPRSGQTPLDVVAEGSDSWTITG